MGDLVGYNRLRKSVERMLSEGLVRAEQAVFNERLRTYWEVGDHLNAYLESADTAYGDQTIARLSGDVGISRRILYDALKFRRLAPKVPTEAHLTFSHYRRLLSVKDAGLQARLLEEARVGGWSVRELNAQIRDGQAGGDTQAPIDAAALKQLQAKRGEPYVYRTIEKQGRLVLDLGFRDARPILDQLAVGLSAGQMVRSVPDGRYEGGYRFEDAEMRGRIYAFPARVERIIDGDTLWATVDLGFNTWADRKLRLRGIDTPELKSSAGLRAKDALTKMLGEVDVFMVTTTKIDLYDRYLADLFVLPGEIDLAGIATEGQFVNRLLVERGLARVWTDEKPEF